MDSPLWQRLRKLDWTAAGIAEKEARSVQKLMQDLASHKEARAMKASQKLWNMLKPPTPLGPVLEPFLIEVRGISTRAVRREIDDLLKRAEE
ncbi:hypothetical protein N9115_02460 [bacterium]|nr:hypothetical protein [Akkermansiaceae bacterium]MDB4266099.1 hypothetical protein [bacterium]MDA7535719.1 hypothetical protein [Akkermansiaceae bacterium]MDA7537679.1 hypothetical protein [Akkermansiaceae bacterium]MDA7862088.1 hypothetical protein [Akkermansiaceae bacterium]